MDNKKNNISDFEFELTLGIAASMERFSQAIREHLKTYEELKRISNFRLNPDYEKINKQAQAGFSAEIKHKARFNAKNILNKRNLRIERTDNIGAVNHPKYDFVQINKNGQPFLDKNGRFIRGLQLKTFFKTPKYRKLLKDKFYKKYQDTKIAIPYDQYESVKLMFEKEIEKLNKQIEQLKNNGDKEIITELQHKIKKIQDVKSRLEKAEVSTKDAMLARNQPALSVSIDVFKISLKAGRYAAQNQAVLGLTVNTIQEAIKVLSKNKEVFEASKVTIKTVKDSTDAFGNAFVSSLIGGMLSNSNKQLLQNLAKKNYPSAIVKTASILAKQTYLLISGKLSIDEFVQNIGVEGFSLSASLTGSNMGAVIGGTILPGTGVIVGGIIGSMIATIIASSTYNEILQTLEQAKLSAEHRQMIEKFASFIIQEEKVYRKELEQIFSLFFDEKQQQISGGLTQISQALTHGTDINAGLKQLAAAFDVDFLFDSPKSLRDFLQNDNILKI